MRIQQILNSDIAMIFDECTLYPVDEEMARISMGLSLRWAERSKRAHESDGGNPNESPQRHASAVDAWRAGSALHAVHCLGR